MPSTLFDLVVTHPELADSTNFLLLSLGLNSTPSAHSHPRVAVALAIQSADVLDDFGRSLGLMLRHEFGAVIGQDILHVLVETASQALHDV